MTERESQAHFLTRCIRASYREFGVYPEFAVCHPRDVTHLGDEIIVRVGRDDRYVTIVPDVYRSVGTILMLATGRPKRIHFSTVGCTDCLELEDEPTIEPEPGTLEAWRCEWRDCASRAWLRSPVLSHVRPACCEYCGGPMSIVTENQPGRGNA